MKSIKDVRDILSYVIDEKAFSTNASVIHHILENHPVVKGKKRTIPYKQVAEQLAEKFSILNISIARSVQKIRFVFDSYKSLVNHVDRNWDKICSFLSTEFFFPSEDSAELCGGAPVSVTITCENSPPANNRPTQSHVVTPVKTRKDCLNCPSAKKAIVSLKRSLKGERQAAFKLKLAAANVKRAYKVRENKQKVKRQNIQINALKQKYSNSHREADSLRRAKRRLTDRIDGLAKLNSHLESKNNKLAKENLDLHEQLKNLQCKIKSLEKERKQSDRSIDDLICQHEEIESEENLNENIFISKKGKTYDVDIRMCIYYELMYDVPVSRCGQLIAAFLKIINGQQMKNVPAASTCAQMAFELGVLSTVRLMEFMTSQKQLCLSWDATTVDGSHVNEIHLTANKVDCLVLDVRHLPGGKTADYVTHIMSALTESAAIYSRFTGIAQAEVLAVLKAAISSTLTDRAAVNACVTRQLCNEMDSQLMQLNCNIHPLDSVARSTKASLKQVDRDHNIQGSCYGSEGSAANLINAISVLRFKDGTGDPLGFKNFLKQNNLPVGTFVRYVGNRIHVLFHLAGLIVLHRDKLLEFIDCQCCAAVLIRTCVSRDLKNDKIVGQVWALAMLGKLLTGPWMTRFYSSTFSNLEMAPFIKLCIQNMKCWLEDPKILLHPITDAFDKELDPSTDDVLSSLLDFAIQLEHVQLMLDALKGVLAGALSILERQLAPFLIGEYSQPSIEAQEISASAPTHNMASERTLGCLDKMWRRAPNASLGFLNGKVRFKMNKVMEWLERKSAKEREQLVRFVVSEARDERGKESLRHEKLVGDIAERRKEVSEERLKKKKTSAMRQIRQALINKNASALTFPDSVIRRIEAFILDSDSVLGTLLIHSWGNVEWYGRILRVTGTQGASKFDIAYWTLDEAESNSSDFSISVASFYAEVAVGTIVFV